MVFPVIPVGLIREESLPRMSWSWPGPPPSNGGLILPIRCLIGTNRDDKQAIPELGYSVVSGADDPPVYQVALIVCQIPPRQLSLELRVMVPPTFSVGWEVVGKTQPVADVIEVGKKGWPGQAADVLSERGLRPRLSDDVDEGGPEVAAVDVASVDTAQAERLTGGTPSAERDLVGESAPRLLPHVAR